MIVNKVLKLGKYGQKDEDRVKISMLSSTFGLIMNIFLAIMKVVLALTTGSVSILADAINNATDSISSITTLVGAKLSGLPADREHPYGHGRIEYISALVVSVFVLYTGVEFIRTSYNRIINPVELNFSVASILLMILSILIKLYMTYFYKIIGDKINSTPAKAQSKDSLADVFVTGVVVFSIIIGKLTGKVIDGYVGIFISLIIIYSGYELIRETLSTLIGEMPEDGFVDRVKEIVLKDSRILGVHDIEVFKFGPQKTYVTLDAEIDYNTSLVRAHKIVDIAEERIREELKCDVCIHIDPVGQYTEEELKISELLNSIVKTNKEILSYHDLYHFDDIIRVELEVDGDEIKTREDKEQIIKLVEGKLKSGFDYYRYNIIIDRCF